MDLAVSNGPGSGCFWIFVCFLIVQKKQAINGITTFLNLRFYLYTQKPTFFEKILHVNKHQVEKGH